MNYKWIGAVLVLLSCGGCGFSMAASHRGEEKLYRNMIRLTQYMKTELQYRLTPLPDLCQGAAMELGGIIGRIFVNLSYELQNQILPDAASCMQTVLNQEKTIPSEIRKLLLEFGRILGRYDLEGQVLSLDAIRARSEESLALLKTHREERLRGYQTLGLCAGAALVVLFI